MPPKRLLLLSNSKNSGQGYLDHAETAIRDFLGRPVSRVLFVPFASVRNSFGDFAALVRQRFERMGYGLDSVHEVGDKREAVRQAEAIVVGGGNTFHLLREMYGSELLEAVRSRVTEGAPYIGWSAGSNLACPTIKTTNDMPIVQPPSFDALGLIPFQINPHYTDSHPPGHQGETRAERIAEFVEVNPGRYVVGLPEGDMLMVEGSRVKLIGDKPVKVFLKGAAPADYDADQPLEFLFERVS